MKGLHRLWRQLAATITRTASYDELTAEIEEHLQWQTEDNIRSGMTPEEARRAALLKFGSVESAKQEYRESAQITSCRNTSAGPPIRIALLRQASCFRNSCCSFACNDEP